MKPTEPIPTYGNETYYRGVWFRGRTEAVWAAVFDLLKLPWEYEPNGDSTFPDFRIGSKASVWYVEVKGGLGRCLDRNGHVLPLESHPDFQRFALRLGTDDDVTLAGPDCQMWRPRPDSPGWVTWVLRGTDGESWSRACKMVANAHAVRPRGKHASKAAKL